MQIIITILLSVAGFAALLLFIALFIPRHYSVMVSAVINQPKGTVFDYIKLLENQFQYSEWLRNDRTLQPNITGIDGTVGAVLRWESTNPDKNKSSGKGEQEIQYMDNDSIHVELRLLAPMPGTCKLSNHFAMEDSGSTRYTCTFFAYAKYPVNLPSYFLGRHFIRRTQQKTLSNIKSILEES